MCSSSDAYEVLGVGREATQAEIRRAYLEEARACHPDVNPSSDATLRFQAVTKAYKLLSDPDRRAQYDGGGSDGAGDQEEVDEPGMRAMFRGVLQELYAEQLLGSISSFGSEAAAAASSARSGDLRPARDFIWQRKGLALAVVLPTFLMLRFPAAVAIFLRFTAIVGVGAFARLVQTEQGQQMAYNWAWLKWRVFLLRVRARARAHEKKSP